MRPDTTRFRAELEAQLRAATAKPIVIPVTAAVSSSVGAAAAASGALAAQQRAATGATLGLASAAAVENSAFGQQAVILRSATAATAQLAGAQTAAASVARASAAAAATQARQLGQLERGAAATALTFLGLRGATLAASGAFLAGTVATVAFAKAIGSAAQLETSLAVFEVTAEATAAQMERVSATARELGSDLTLPGVTANQAADALAQLARAGLTVEDSISGVRGALQLATAAAIGNEEAVTLVASALNAFQLSGSQAVRVADLLAASANESQGSISDMGLALQQSAAAAHQAGVSLSDTVSLLTLLARAGLRGSDAGTSLRVALIRLIAPTEQAQKEMKSLGVNIRDASGNVRPEVFADLTQQLNRLTKAQRDATLVTIFGTDAFRAAAIIGGAAAQGLREAQAAVEKQGVAAEVAAARNRGLAGAAERVKNEFAALGLKAGDAFKGPATTALNAFAASLDIVNAGIEKTVGLAKSLEERNDEQIETWAELAQVAGRFNAELARGVGGARGRALVLDVEKLNQALLDQQSAGLKAAGALEEYRINARLAADASEGLNNRIDESFDRFQRLADAVKEASRGLFLGPTEKADIASILAGGTEGLEDDIAAAQRRLDLINKRLQDFKGNRNQFAALVKEQAQAQAELARLRSLASNQAQTAAKAAATAARQELAAADAELLARQALARNRLENLIAAAALTPILSDDIRRQQELRALVRRQIEQITDQIKDATTQKQALVALRAVLIQVASALKNLAEQQKQLAQQRRDALTDILGQRLRLAELRGGRDEILNALNAAIADAQRRVKAAKTLADRLDEQIALQELINQRNDLLAQKTEDGNKAAEFFFEQLQAQQGFAANLLGNLIPTSQTSGLVGVPAVGAPTIPVSPAGGAGGDVDIGFGAAAGLAEGKGRTSPTAGQASTTNEILRRILKELKDLNRAADSPEAVYQRKMGSAAMSGGGGNTEV